MTAGNQANSGHCDRSESVVALAEEFTRDDAAAIQELKARLAFPQAMTNYKKI